MTKTMTRNLMGADIKCVPFPNSPLLGKLLLLFFGLWLLIALTTVQSHAQSITSGDVTGTVTDPTGASVPGATVTLTNVGTNTSQQTTANNDGSYRFAFVPPGIYKVRVTAGGFQSQEHPGVVVSAGQPTTVSVQLMVAGASQTVDVVEAAGSVQTQNADVGTNFDTAMVENLPNPGMDLTYYAQTAPGVVMNTNGGNGNFSALGMPGTSNLFTINGMNDNDPFFNVNNSGASNLMLGANDVAEANVINNAYSGQYGQLAGSQVAYITRSGTNDFHGDAIYNWNGRLLNANQFFNDSVGLPTPFNNFNQWAAGFHGPVIKNRTFFDADYEGLRYLLPGGSTLTLVPSQQYQAATLANITANGNAAEVPFYQQIFKIYNGAPGTSAATPVPGGGCPTGFTGLAAGVPCALQFRSTPPDINKEYLWSGRVDHVFSDKDRGYIRVLRDNGFQPTYASPYGATFNEESNQPQMQGQVSETHVFGPNSVNQFNASVLFYAAVFTPADAGGALSALPTYVNFSGGGFSQVGALGEPPGFFFPQGRRVFQYQISDDFSRVAGKHTFRLGFSWVHQTVTDLDFNALAGPINGEITTDLTDFYNGGGANTSLNQAFPLSPEQGIKFNIFGGYVADDWKVSDRLTLSMNLRLENFANPTCDANCFARPATTFDGANDPNAVNTPYNQFLTGNQHTAYPNTQTVVWEPRIGIAWRPFNNDKTVIRTGAGIFADALPGALAEQAAFNAPNLNSFVIPGVSGSGAVLPIAPGVAGGLFGAASAANQALLSQFKSGGSFSTISQAVPTFSAPSLFSFPAMFSQPRYYKWNFEIEQSIGSKMLLSVNYSGMHGSHIPVNDGGLNAYCPPTVCTSGFVGLPSVVPNAAFGQVSQYMSAGYSNYNGLIISLQRRLAAGLTFNLNYTWSHNLDIVSNGGVSNLQFGIFQTDPEITLVQNPHDIRSQYGNADYDIRHYFSANFVYSDMFRHSKFKWGPNAIFGGWTLSSNWYLRSGMPFTVIDQSANGTLFGYNYNGFILASPTGYVPGSCTSAVNSPCLNTSQFAPSAAANNGVPTGFGTIGRNSIYGPHFFDVDMALMKDVRIKERFVFSFGAQAFNVFNHPNFDQPTSDISNPNFGLSTAEVAPPTSLLGAFVPGTAASPRFLEIKGMLRF